MISRECFAESLQVIRKQDAVLSEASKVLQKLSDFPVSLDYFGGVNRQALLKVLAEVMRDKNGWISWWLYEDVEKIVTWDENREEIKADLTDVNALYDFLVREIRDAQAEQLPLRDYDGEVLFPECAHKVMELKDFQVYFESTLRYVNQSNIVLHVNEGDEGKYVLMPIQCYEKIMGYTVGDEKEGKMDQSLELVEIEVDQELQKQVEERLKPYGVTMEDLVSGFFRWCAEKPEEATAYLNRLVEGYDKGKSDSFTKVDNCVLPNV